MCFSVTELSILSSDELGEKAGISVSDTCSQVLLYS